MKKRYYVPQNPRSFELRKMDALENIAISLCAIANIMMLREGLLKKEDLE